MVRQDPDMVSTSAKLGRDSSAPLPPPSRATLLLPFSRFSPGKKGGTSGKRKWSMRICLKERDGSIRKRGGETGATEAGDQGGVQRRMVVVPPALVQATAARKDGQTASRIRTGDRT